MFTLIFGPGLSSDAMLDCLAEAMKTSYIHGRSEFLFNQLHCGSCCGAGAGRRWTFWLEPEPGKIRRLRAITYK